MKNIALFSIPAHGHTNPMLPVAAELVNRGNTVRFYSFNEFKEKINATGAEFISCDAYLPELTKEQEEALKNVSTTEMTLQDIRTTLKMNSFLEKEFNSFKPDVVYTDAVCFWGKLNAWKFKVPMVVSTSTFAFNQMSTKYMKQSSKELADMIFGLPKISKELKTLEPYGYHIKNALELVRNDNDTDTVVYTSESFQPYSESFTDHYAFVGPSVFSKKQPEKEKERPLVYISLGTVINDRPDFYHKCIEALKDINADIVFSCGKYMDIKKLGVLPENIKAYPYVDQLEILSKADAFITHCGMNSVSESLYMATPMALYPQTSEQYAVAKRVLDKHAGVILSDDSAEGIKKAVTKLLENEAYRKGARECSEDFRACSGTTGAADFIENAPHKTNGKDLLKELNKLNGRFRIFYWVIAVTLLVLFGVFITWNYAWIIGVAAGVLYYPIGQAIQNPLYNRLVKKNKHR